MIHGELDKAQRQVHGAAGRVKQQALKSVEALETRVSANEQRLKESADHFTSEITGVKQATTQAQSGVAAVSSEVRDVRTDVANTRTQLDRTVADLRRVTGDLGVMSGLIATNQKEIDALRQLGDRNYTEFTVRKTKTPVKVGDVMVLLKKADAGRKRYTVELQADDSKIEKKDRAANEPGSILRGAQQAAARAGGESGSEGRGGRLPGDAEGRSRPPVTLSRQTFFDARQPHVHFIDLADQKVESGVQPVFQARHALVEHQNQSSVDQDSDQRHAQRKVELGVGHHDSVHVKSSAKPGSSLSRLLASGRCPLAAVLLH